jgi:alpha-L-rhamnosidase
MTPYGEAASGWRLDGDTITITARIPANTHATIILPDDSRREIGSGDYEFKWRR